MKRRRNPPQAPAAPLRAQRSLIVATRFIIDLQHWVGTDPRMALRILRIELELARDPRVGIGKPERLKHDHAGDCSRRLDREHRVVYRYDDATVEFISARRHYE